MRVNADRSSVRAWMFCRSLPYVLGVWLSLLLVGTAKAESWFEHFTEQGSSQTVHLIGRDARQQLIVSERQATGEIADRTRELSWAFDKPNIADIDSTGWLRPLSVGETVLRAKLSDGSEVSVPVVVSSLDDQRPINFTNQVIPIFTKYGCNGGGCHGKAVGQNGFRLSLLGFEPRDDYERIVNEGRGRRLFPAAPDRSLLLTKATNLVPHGGGQRLQVDSDEFRLLCRWISQGMPLGSEQDAKIAKIQVYPSDRAILRSQSQQLMVLATFTDGSVMDVTRSAQFESNDTDLAEVTMQGLVTTHQVTGDAAVMVRYQGQVTVFNVSVPLPRTGETIWPESKSYVDPPVFAKLQKLGLSPAAVCDDASFLRRVTLDIAGRLPTLTEIDAFRADTSATKRAVVIERLLDSEEYADFFATKWNSILRNRRKGAGYQYGTFAFHHWIRQCFAENRPFDQFVRDIVAGSGSIDTHPPVAWYREVSDINQRVEDASQLFLGQRIQCARCHHHPYEKWSQQDYAQMSAFFSLVTQKNGSTGDEPAFYSRVGTAASPHPKTGASLTPVALSAERSDIAPTEDPRERLVDWMVDPSNPFFAKTLVNRYWKHFFGVGIVEPEDDLRVTNPPSNPQLLDELAKQFIESGYDLKQLVRSICNSSVYQFSADGSEEMLNDRKSFVRHYPKRLSAEVLLDAIDDLVETRTVFAGLPSATRAISLPDTSFESYFLTVFGRPDSSTACECERTQEANLAQSLHLLNSKQLTEKLSVPTGRAALMAEAKDRPTANRVQEIYLRAFSREPREEELATSVAYLDGKGGSKEAYEDFLWVLINSKEFMFNH